MKNSVFNIKVDSKTGGIKHFELLSDPQKMNFCKAGRTFCCVNDNGDRMKLEVNQGLKFDYNILAFSVDKIVRQRRAVVVYAKSRGVDLITEYKLSRNKVFVKTTLRNTNTYPMYYRDGDISIDMPFNDAYESSDICMRERTHTHIWAGGEVCYIRTERMGLNDNNVGVFFTKGNISSYSQSCVYTHHRGLFELNLAPFKLNGGEETQIEYFFFTYKDKEEFFNELKKQDRYLHVDCPKGFTVDFSDNIEFEIISKKKIEDAFVEINGEKVGFDKKLKSIAVSYKPLNCGKNEVKFCINGVTGKAVFNVISSVEELIEKRIKFIVENQQCLDKDSQLYGAYLIYDNEEKLLFCNTTWPDYNPCRERLGMAISIVKWLQTHRDEKVKKSLELYIDFLLREAVDESTGHVFGNIGKDEKTLRLYNPPWFMLLFAEYYELTKDIRWAKLVYVILKYYYGNGGSRFYPNGIRFQSLFACLKNAGLSKELEEVLPLYKQHVETIMKNGLNYPPHEVNFEQTIVTPAVTLLLDMYAITNEKIYLDDAEKHLKILSKFDGCQPDCRLNKIPIRFWDDYWFGKSEAFGDTLHYWSTLSGYCFYMYGKLSKKPEWVEYGKQCVKNCSYLFGEDGTGSCACVIPKLVNGKKGDFLDVFANDQDFALYFMMKVFCE